MSSAPHASGLTRAQLLHRGLAAGLAAGATGIRRPGGHCAGARGLGIYGTEADQIKASRIRTSVAS